MDVSIAVSLIRGQMGTVVERAVNGAVETVLAEMLKVVGVKFEDLKTQLALMKRAIVALQREKALKEKENNNIRAKLRYTELKLKYYRQGVEEELQQRASASTLVHIHPSTFHQTLSGAAGLYPNETSTSRSLQIRTTDQECTSPQSTSICAIRIPCRSDVGVANSDSSVRLQPVSLSVNAPAESLGSSTVFSLTERDILDGLDADVAPPPVQALTPDRGEQSWSAPLSSDGSTQADGSTLPSTVSQVKQEAEEEEEEKVISIKEEPEEDQEVMATLLQDWQVKQGHGSESEAPSSVSEWSGLSPSQRLNNTTTFSPAGPSTCVLSDLVLQQGASLPSIVSLPSAIPPHQGVWPWTKNLSLNEEYKLHRNELRRRSLNRRRELEKTLPQPLLADLDQERREKTRLRVARWRAKRKLQACLNQAQEIRASHASTSSNQRKWSQSSGGDASAANGVSAALPFVTSTCSPSLFPRGPHGAVRQPTVTSASYPQINPSQQSFSLTDTETLE